MEDLKGSLFKRDIEDYKTNINPIAGYINQATKFVEVMFNQTPEEARKTVLAKIKEYGIIDPEVTYRQQGETGDRTIEKSTLSQYLKDTIEKNEIMAPSFTTYTHPSVKKSLHSEFLGVNLAKRKADKKAAFKAKQADDMYKFNYYNTLQKTRKVANNSLSGAYASKSTILFNPSAHYTLTSITRSVASIGNAITESLVGGNKIFKKPENVVNYITAIITNIDMRAVEYCINKYTLHMPTVDEVMVMIDHGSRWYWKDDDYRNYIKTVLGKLSPLERSAVLYVNDMYHLRMYNEAFVRKLVTELSQRVEHGSVNHLKDLNSAVEGIPFLAHFIWADELRGMDINYEKMEGTPLLEKLASTAKHLTERFDYYRYLIRTFYTSDILPIDIANIKDTLRDVIVLSDTDSTCGSYEEWIHWYYHGDMKITNEAIAVSAVIMTINTQVMDHNIKVFAKNMNIDKSNMDTLAMKNEFFWPVFVPANVSKHYYADVMVQEGNVFKNNDLELKGVHLISSNIDQSLIAEVKKMMGEVFETVKRGDMICLFDYLTRVANIERGIVKKLSAGDLSVFKMDKIKSANSYKKGEVDSPYIHHILWETVFADKYGHSAEPSYSVIKVPTIINTAKDMKDFCDNIKDVDIKYKLKQFLEKTGKDKIGVFRLPIAVIGNKGIPEELRDIIDVERVIKDNCNVFYMFLATLGGYKKPTRTLFQMGY